MIRPFVRQSVGRGRDERAHLLLDPPPIGRLLEWLSSGLPTVATQWLAGPMNEVRVSSAGHVVEGSFRRWRPTRIIVASDLVLRKRVQVPGRSRRDIWHVAELFIRSETPFALSEVFARLLTSYAGGSDRPRHELLIMPTWPVERALAGLRIDLRHVGGIFVADGDRPISLGPARRSIEQVANLAGWATPLVIVIGALLHASTAELAVRQHAISELEAVATQEMASLRGLLSERDALEEVTSKLHLVRETFAYAAPTGWLLAALRNVLPESTDVGRIELRERSLRLQVRTPDALGVARTIDQALTGWSAAIDGTITSDPRGRESATLLIAQRDRAQ